MGIVMAEPEDSFRQVENWPNVPGTEQVPLKFPSTDDRRSGLSDGPWCVVSRQAGDVVHPAFEAALGMHDTETCSNRVSVFIEHLDRQACPQDIGSIESERVKQEVDDALGAGVIHEEELSSVWRGLEGFRKQSPSSELPCARDELGARPAEVDVLARVGPVVTAQPA